MALLVIEPIRRARQADTLQVAGFCNTNGEFLAMEISLEDRGRRIEFLIDLERFDQALKECHELLAIEPDHFIGRYSLIRCLQHSRKLDEGLEQSLALISLFPHDASAHYLHSYQLNFMDRKAEAIQASRKAVECEPQDGFYRAILSAQLWYADQLEQAMEQANQALELNPLQSEATLVRALTLMEWGQLELAEEVAISLLNQEPESSPAAHTLAMIRFYQGRFGQAEKILLEILQSEPGSRREDYQNNLELIVRHRFLPFACWQRVRLMFWHLARKRSFLVVREGDRCDHFQQLCTILLGVATTVLTCWWVGWLPLIATLALASEHMSLPAICRNRNIRKIVNHNSLEGYTFFSCGWALVLGIVLVACVPELQGMAFLIPAALFLLAPFFSLLAVNKSHHQMVENRFAAIGFTQILMLFLILPLGLLHRYWPGPGLLGAVQVLGALYLLPLPPALLYLGARYILESTRPEEPQTFVLS